MYAQRPSSASSHSIRKISPRVIAQNVSTPPCTQENWQHLVNIVMKLVKDKQNKDSVIKDLAERLTQMETTFDQAPIPETFTINSVPQYLRGRLRRSYVLISKSVSARSTRRSSYRLTFHQYLGVAGLGIGVSRGHGAYRARETEKILFLSSEALETLVTSIAGEKERKLPDVLLKYLQMEKREFVRDWMRGFINLERDDEEYVFSVDYDRCVEKDIFIEYLGMYDGMGSLIEENKFVSGKKCSHEIVDTVPVSRMDVVV